MVFAVYHRVIEKWHSYTILAASLLAWATTSCNPGANTEGSRDPIADYPERIDLGEREIGDIATTKFRVANRGSSELIFDHFSSNCSCSGIERVQNGTAHRLETLHVEPGEEVELQMRVSVRGVPIGSRSANGVTFRTNDPKHPQGRIEAVISRVKGGVFTLPNCLGVGTVLVGSKVVHLMEIRDDAINPRSLDHVTISQPDRLSARIIKSAKETPNSPKGQSGVRIALLELSINTETPGDFDINMTLHLAGVERLPEVVRVFGRVAPAVEISPQFLVLPRASSEGLIYRANCILRSNLGTSLSMSVDSCPPGLRVVLQKAKNKPSSIVVFTVVLDPKANTPSGGGKQVVRLRYKSGDLESMVDLNIQLTP